MSMDMKHMEALTTAASNEGESQDGAQIEAEEEKEDGGNWKKLEAGARDR